MAKSLRQRRHKARILAMQAIFQIDARPEKKVETAELITFSWVDYALPDDERDFAQQIITVTMENLAGIDSLITERLVNWELDRISPVSRAILRTGVAQLKYLSGEADAAVVIDEAILLAKQYDAAEAAGFINGLLDDVRRLENPAAIKVAKKKPAPLTEKIKIKKKPIVKK